MRRALTLIAVCAATLMPLALEAAKPVRPPPAPSPVVVVDANGSAVGPLIWIPNDPGFLYYGDVAAAYRVGEAIARVGFAASTETYGVLTRIYPVINLKYVTANCTGQAYLEGGLPNDYRPYSSFFVSPPTILGAAQVAPARVMQQTTRESYVSIQSSTTNDGTCVSASGFRNCIEADFISEFPFTLPFAIR